jgi:hypothetical protein
MKGLAQRVDVTPPNIAISSRGREDYNNEALFFQEVTVVLPTFAHQRGKGWGGAEIGH